MFVSTGEGQTSEGEFWESLNTAANLKLPVVYLVEDNGYAISVPVEVNTAGGSISKLVRSFPNLFIEEVDGCDLLASYDTMQRAVDYASAEEGAGAGACEGDPPVLALAVRRREALPPDRGARRRCGARPGDAVPEMADERRTRDRRRDQERSRRKSTPSCSPRPTTRWRSPSPAPETVYYGVYSPDVDPTSEQFDTEDDPQFSGDPTTMVDLLNACMRDEMRRDQKILVFGQDVADVSREEYLDKVKGKGGVFKVTWRLQKEFGSARVYNSPLAEANIVGRAIGLAVRGFKPVVEVQFFDYIWTAYMQLRDELATMRWRSNNNFSAPVVVRTTYGGYIRGAIYHSQTGAALFTHCPGLRVVCPATALDANGLLRTAIRCDDPVLFLEHKHLYRQTYNKSPYPGPNFMIPFGKAKVVREGADVTVVTYGATVQRAITAANAVADNGISVEVIDLRTLSPWDREAVFDVGEEEFTRHRRVRGLEVMGLRRRDRGVDRRRVLRVAGRAGDAGGLDRHFRRLRAEAGGRDSAAGRRFQARVRGNSEVLN